MLDDAVDGVRTVGRGRWYISGGAETEEFKAERVGASGSGLYRSTPEYSLQIALSWKKAAADAEQRTAGPRQTNLR